MTRAAIKVAALAFARAVDDEAYARAMARERGHDAAWWNDRANTHAARADIALDAMTSALAAWRATQETRG